MNQLDVIQHINLLSVLSRWVVLSGSASAMMHFKDFRRAGDIDLVAHPVLFVILCVFRPRGWKLELPSNIKKWRECRLANDDLNIEMFMCWRSKRGYVPYRQLRQRAHLILGVYCASLPDILEYKRWLFRRKDVLDVKKIVELVKGVALRIFNYLEKILRTTIWNLPNGMHQDPVYIDTG